MNFWSSRNESKPLSKQKCVLRKCCGVSQKWWMLELPNLCHMITSRNFWSSRNERKVLSKLKHVFRKCCRLYQKWWMLKLPNLCHCVQHPWKLTSRNFWGSRNESKPLSKQKMCFEKMLWGISEMVNARAYKSLPLLTSRNFWSSNEMKLSKLKQLSKQNMFWENAVGYLRNCEC